MLKFTHKVVKRFSKWKKLEASFKAVRASYVKAGVLGAKSRSAHEQIRGKDKGDRPHKGTALTNAQLASVHEYGLGNSPARPWIGPPFRLNRKRYLERLVKSYRKALKDEQPVLVLRELERLGFLMAADIKNYVTQSPLPGVLPANAAITIARKGSSRTLVDSSQMVNSVTHMVITKKAPR